MPAAEATKKRIDVKHILLETGRITPGRLLDLQHASEHVVITIPPQYIEGILTACEVGANSIFSRTHAKIQRAQNLEHLNNAEALLDMFLEASCEARQFFDTQREEFAVAHKDNQKKENHIKKLIDIYSKERDAESVQSLTDLTIRDLAPLRTEFSQRITKAIKTSIEEEWLPAFAKGEAYFHDLSNEIT